MFGSVCLLTVLVLRLVCIGQACPRSCNCYQANEVHCTFRSLLTVPSGLPLHTRRINLGFNSINMMDDSSLAGLKEVELLMLHSNDLQHLPEAAFRDMKSLQILKLSYNKLREISSSLTFSGLSSLLRLYLDHNLIQHIHPRALLQLTSLRLLRLQGNRLHQLHPHSLCTLSLLNTYYFSTLRHLDLSNNSLTTLPRETLATAPLLETLVLQANPWSCDCRMNWFLTWSLAHPGIMKCPSGPQCPICASPNSLQGQGLLDQTDLSCTSPVIPSPERETPLKTEIIEIQSKESFREPVGTASLGLSDQQGNSVNLECNITHSTEFQDIALLPDLSLSSTSPLPLALSLFLECPVERHSYENLWRILAYYSETAVRLERELMLGKGPSMAYRYRQTAETDGYYHTGVKVNVKARPQWLLQPAISIQLNRAETNGNKVQIIYSTRVAAHLDPTSHSSSSFPAFHPWVLISTNHTATALATVAGSKVKLSCPLLSTANPNVQWVLPDGSILVSPSSSLDSRLQASTSGLLVHKVQLSDAGIYYCVARAGTDADVLPLRLAVEESSVPPTGEQAGPTVTGNVGQPISLSCKASASPESQISWILPDGNVIRRGFTVSGGVTLQSNGSLSLLNPTLRDAGYYRCIAVNQYGSNSLSIQLKLYSQHPTPLRTSFPTGPQSAAGRSTKIRAPLLVEEGSGYEEKEESTLVGNRRHPRPFQPHLSRRYPIGKARKRGPVREGLPRRGGPIYSADNRRNRFENRHRVTTNKQRIDPQKWADLLAKIRQKSVHTNYSQPFTTRKPTTEPPEGERLEAETEGSSLDDTDLKEGLQHIYPVHTEMQKHTETNADTETDGEIMKGTKTSTETQKDLQNENGSEMVTNPKTQEAPVTSKPIAGTNKIFQEPDDGDHSEANTNPPRTRPQNPLQTRFPSLVPNSQAQNPWKRRPGQRRRIYRPRGRPLTRPPPLPDTMNPRLQTTPSDMTSLLTPTTTSGAILFTPSDHRTVPTDEALNILSPPASNSYTISTSKSASHSLTPSSSSPTKIHIDVGPGKRRRIYRPWGRPLTRPPLLPGAMNPKLQITSSDMTTDQINMLLLTPTTTSGAILFTRSDHRTVPTDEALNLLSPPVSNSYTISTSKSASHSATPSSSSPTSLSPSHTKIHIDTGTHSADISDTAEAAVFNTATTAPTHTDTAFALTHEPHTGIRTHGIQTHTKTHTALGKHVRPPSKHSEEPERNLSGVEYVSHSSISLSPTRSSIAFSTLPSTATTTAAKITKNPATFKRTHSTSTTGRTTSTSTTSTSWDTLLTTITPSTSSPIMSTPTSIIIPKSSTTRSITTSPTSTTTATVNSPILTSTTPITSSTRPSTGTFMTSASTVSTSTIPITTTTTTTTAATTTTTTTPTKSTRISIPAKMSQVTTRAATTSTLSIITTISTSTTPSPRERPSGPVSAGPNQRRPSTDWKNPGTNSIPGSHSSRPQSTSLAAVPRGPVVRSRPRIADPHVRTVSVPAESTARLSCEAQGEPSPSITWTKVATGAVMSIHSRAQRFEVLPNGTLVIQNVQLQDRGTYICSAQSFLGRDRLLTTLEVRTRTPRMLVASYREVTIHQGGAVHLDCQADGVPGPLLSWVLPDRSVLTPSSPSTSRITVAKNGTLHIAVTLPSDRGMYRCVASNSAGAASASARVHVSSLPPVIQQPREEHLLRSPGRPVYAHCSARGAPPPTLRWRIPDGTLVRPSQFLHGNLFVLPNGTLHIRGVGSKESGIYECIASNAVGADKRKVRVEIEGEMEGERRQGGAKNEGAIAVGTVIKTNTSSLHKEGTFSSHPFNPTKLSPLLPLDKTKTYPKKPNPTNLPTKIKAVPASPTYVTNIEKTKPSPLSPPSTLPTNNIKDSPSIVNNTRVTSPSSKSRASAALQPLPVSPFTKARIVSTSPSTTTVYYGLFLQLHCSVTGHPSPIIIWRTPKRKLVDMHFSFDHRLKVHPNGTLSVQAVTEKDAGDYLCIARNKVSDDYRLLRVSVATKPAKIEPKQPLNQMVSFGKALKVDCQASGLPDPAVRWSLPDGTMVNSVLQEEDRGGRARRLTVFDNGTLLVPAVGIGEEGEYTCYAENQGGQDTMKVKVKVMMTSPPAFADGHHLIKVRQGETARIRCQATGVPAPTVTWFSPTRRVIPRSFGSGLYSERVVVASDGTLEVRLAQPIDEGNYTCRASNSAGEKSKVMGLEVEAQSGQVGGTRWSIGPGGGHNGRVADNIDKARLNQYGFTSEDTRKLGRNNSSNGYRDHSPSIRNTVTNTGTNRATSGFDPDIGSESQTGLNRPFSRIKAHFGNIGITVKADSRGTHRNGPNIVSYNNSVVNSHSTVRGDTVYPNPGNNNNEVIARMAGNDANPWRANGKISDTLTGNTFSGSPGIATGGRNSSTAVTTVKQRVVKGQTVLLPCPSQGSPPPRLAWFLPGNGVLPSPYYGSRLTVHRNGSLELRGVRESDAGTLVCVARGEGEQMRIQVELEVSEPQEDRSSHRGPAVEKYAQGSRLSGGSLDPPPPLSSRPVFPEILQSKIPVTHAPVHKAQSLPAAPNPVGPPPRSTSWLSKLAVSSRTAPLVSIINGESLHLSCPRSHTHGYAKGSLTWTMPSGKVMSLGESADSGRYKVQEDGTLVVQKASVFDRGTYICRSTGSGDSSVSLITVPVIVIAYPPRITTGPSPVTYTRPGVAVELPCLTIATPRATLTWETPDLTQLRVMDKARIYGNRYLSPQGSLVIQNPTSRDTGFYRCTAKNVIGVDTKATYLHVI